MLEVAISAKMYFLKGKKKKYELFYLVVGNLSTTIIIIIIIIIHMLHIELTLSAYKHPHEESTITFMNRDKFTHSNT